ncbi:tetratricopeptide repeat protein [Aureibaculum sp. 2210JD6-5]|uniref:tetratricopeptide repeat protein n=1 Tax=Aureibaculum sp. 2210JD6-5 TaxID=3103957 RepID=UPI002AAC78BF|nr:tetratricopeptide repeat protein [Aureibaculum sp. 2210JD6-5]MDY7396833.1 tetratricopeptide repeat protein [Aureibaculum sp. 2210JD6-5]
MKKLTVLLFLFSLNFVGFAQSFQDSYIEGIQKMDEKKYNNAIEKFDLAIKTNPDFEEAYLKRGACYVFLNDTKKAVLDFSKVIELNPKNGLAYFNRGVVLKTLADYKNAILDFGSAIKFSGNLKFAYYNRALCKLALDDFKNACLDLSKAADLGVENATEIYNYTCKK